MVIGILTMEFTLHDNFSLKGKRNVANSLKRKLRNKFNVAVAEVDGQDNCARLVLAAVTVSNTRVSVESRLTKALAMVEAISPEELTDSCIEFV